METQDPQDTEITMVGMEFHAGIQGDIEIGEARGFNVAVLDSGLYQSAGGELMWPMPRYCQDAAACLELLEELEVFPFIMPTIREKNQRKYTPGFVGVFDMNDTLHMTTSQPTEDAAAACVLWFVLHNKSVVT